MGQEIKINYNVFENAIGNIKSDDLLENSHNIKTDEKSTLEINETSQQVHKDIESIFKMLGNALKTDVTNMKKMGIEFKELDEKTKKLFK